MSTLRLSPNFAHTLLERSPSHAWTESRQGGNERQEPTPAMLRGLVVDALFFGNDAKVVRVPFDAWRTDKAKLAKAEALAAGLYPCLTAELDEIQKALAVQKITLAKDYHITLSGGESKKEVEWTNSQGVECKGEIDHLDLEGGYINELKSTENAHPGYRGRNAPDAGQDIQAAAYMEAIETLEPKKAGRMRFRWFFLEPDPPYAVVVAVPSGEMMQLGQQRWARAGEIFKRCVKTGIWTSYTEPGEVVSLSPPGWALSAEFEATTMADIVSQFK